MALTARVYGCGALRQRRVGGGGGAEMPLGGTLVRAPGTPSSNVFNLTVPRVRIFDLVCEPRLVCTVTHATSPSGAPAVRIESRQCELKGSPFIESLSKCYDFHVVTHFTWSEKAQHAQGAARPTCPLLRRPPAEPRWHRRRVGKIREVVLSSSAGGRMRTLAQLECNMPHTQSNSGEPPP